MYKKELRKRYPETSQGFIFAAASLLGDLTGSVWLCPSEVIKQKMQAGIFASEREALTSIWKNHGFFGLYEGYLGGVARDVPFRVAQLVSCLAFDLVGSARDCQLTVKTNDAIQRRLMK